jgi:predicted AAA+ superfamily ATPase
VNINVFFDGNLSVEKIIQYLEVVTEQRIIAADTLMVLDEIQSCPRALLSLKSFAENAPQYHIIIAGSLLGVAINRSPFSFLVGKVDELQMYPMDFGEYLLAVNKQSLKEEIEGHFGNFESMHHALHITALAEFKKYLIIGGMPACVNEYNQANSFLSIRDVQARILNE